MKQNQTKIQRFWKGLGPGVVTGAADDDPSGIFTYTQSGAQFGLAQIWLAIFLLPLLIAVQEMSARISIVTKKGLTKVMRENYSKYIVYGIIFLLVAANTINLGADLGAMAAVAKLFFNAPLWVFAALFAAIILYLEITLPYRKYASVLKWLSFSLLAYILTGLISGPNWKEVLHATFIPHIDFSFGFLLIVTGVVGTTISPYLFFWEASQEVEEAEETIVHKHRFPKVSLKMIANMRMDNFIGMVFSEITTWFIILTGAAVLHAHGITDIRSAADAAAALQPLLQTFPFSGEIAQALFAIGIIGTGMLAIPIFAATSSYAVSELMNFREGLNYHYKEARAFYAVIIAGFLIGFIINIIGVDPIRFLIYTAVINGIVSVPIIFILWRISNSKKIMGKYTNGFWTNLLVGITFVGMALAAIGTFYTLFG